MSEIDMLLLADENYPSLLKHIADPPPQLYCRGKALDIMPPMVGIVGARRCTEYGESVAYKLGKELASLGFTVVSGMAGGADSFAHQGALDAGGTTVAVLGCGVDICYPRHNRQLMDDIIKQGCIVSEYPPGTGALAHHFPQRNRIISGLCMGIVVVEAAARSGSLITARCALSQGRRLMAVPGSVFNEHSIGANALIRDGAALVTSGQDIQAALAEPLDTPAQAASSVNKTMIDRKPMAAAQPKPSPAARPAPSNPLEARLYEHISYEARTADELSYRSDMHIKDVLGALSMLEIHGFIRRTQGQRFVRTV